MRGVRWAMYVWPGLPDLWWRGAWSGFAAAGAFALLASLVVSATWVWGELLGSNRGGTIWTGFAVGWVALQLVALRRIPRNDEPAATAADDSFPAALVQYLRGNWIDAEIGARDLLKKCPADVEAGLLLTAVLRHANRFDEARETLDALGLWDRAAAWQVEIRSEYERLIERENRLVETHPEPATPPTLSDQEEEQEMLEYDVSGKALPEWRKAA